MTPVNRVELAGKLVELGALRHTPAGLAAVEFKLRHESAQVEAGGTRKVHAEIEALAFDSEARLIAAAPLDSMLRVEGFLCAKTRRSKRAVLHATRVEFIEGV